MPRRAPFERQKFRLPRVPVGLGDSRLETWLAELRQALEDLPFDFAPAWRLSRASSQSIPTSTVTVLSFGGIDKDQGIGLAGAVTAVTIPRTGWYALSAGVQWESNNTGARLLQLVDGTGRILRRNRYLPTTSSENSISCVRDLEKGSTVAVQVFQSSGGPLNATPVGDLPGFTGCWVNPLDENA